MNLDGKTCETVTRINDGVKTTTCGKPATHVVFTPAGRRLVCEDDAARYASAEGFLVRPAADVCEACGAINVSRPILRLYCWCGAVEGVQRMNVDGLWYTLCPIHKAPPLSSLGFRLMQRVVVGIARFIRPPPRLSEAEILRLTEDAKRRNRQ